MEYGGIVAATRLAASRPLPHPQPSHSPRPCPSRRSRSNCWRRSMRSATASSPRGGRPLPPRARPARSSSATCPQRAARRRSPSCSPSSGSTARRGARWNRPGRRAARRSSRSPPPRGTKPRPHRPRRDQCEELVLVDRDLVEPVRPTRVRRIEPVPVARRHAPEPLADPGAVECRAAEAGLVRKHRVDPRVPGRRDESRLPVSRVAEERGPSGVDARIGLEPAERRGVAVRPRHQRAGRRARARARQPGQHLLRASVRIGTSSLA